MRPILILLGVALAAITTPARADEPFPSRPVTMVNPFPPGGIADLTGRPLATAMERALKQPVVVSNKAGAAGAVGAHAAATAKKDGYTILIHVPAVSTIPEVDALFGRAPKYTRDQLIALARINADPTMLVVNVDTPWKSLKELLDDARKRPGQITYASSGPYGASHMPMEMLLDKAGGLKMRHLPTTGGGPAMTAVLGNHAALWMSPPGVAAPHLKSGKIRALAVTGSARHPYFPDVPTARELGYDVEYYLWTGMFAPRGIPADATKTLGDAIRKAVQDPEFKASMDKIQVPIAYQDADEFDGWWDRDAKVLAEVIRKIGKIETN
jgi:tripartite-type tricarboxylate transporter receptor subunit TctC